MRLEQGQGGELETFFPVADARDVGMVTKAIQSGCNEGGLLAVDGVLGGPRHHLRGGPKLDRDVRIKLDIKIKLSRKGQKKGQIIEIYGEALCIFWAWLHLDSRAANKLPRKCYASQTSTVLYSTGTNRLQ